MIANGNSTSKNNYKSGYLQLLTTLEKVIFNLNEENIELSFQQTIDSFDNNFPYSYNLVISNLVFYSFFSQAKSSDIFLSYLKLIQIKEEEINKNIPNLIEIFSRCIIEAKLQEQCYLLENMIEQNLIDRNILTQVHNLYFAHYMKFDEIERLKNNKFYYSFIQNYDELSKNNWELHKKLIEEGHNPNEVAKIIRNDEIEKLQEMSTQSNFDINQIIAPSLYERCTFINQGISLIDYAAFFGSIKCFKYLLMNNANVENTGKYAVAGGNLEIIHLCEQNHSSFEETSLTAIKFHQNDIFHYLCENKIIEINDLNYLGSLCIYHNNFEIFSFLEKEGMKINNGLYQEAAKNGNMYLIKHFHKDNKIPKNILVFSSESQNIELVKYCLKQKELVSMQKIII